ncbi:hypothetical protein Dda_4706 [Drechslerella dactyloides]|uniref:Uncharacterized protein n=1 Tax=Drechslerella dactyloides TaxID=74499 RepID=A0AAD6IXF0_DREDA|nr:hypothetical protein Dda_4706 [Drechslerella dactyloides]
MSGYNEEMLAGTKIEPLQSPTKVHAPTEHMGGSVGEDEIVESSRIGPLKTTKKFQQPEAKSHAGGSTGTNETIAGANIEPLHSNFKGKDAKKASKK